ncbi:hypothetical protein RCH17_001262 [Arthrobacter sp. MP_M7]|nr:hypothetical protein [Arthrobacter sp. MP_M4]MEC5202466.1 hypothetical protein [Arthrobacter sp. MP_M7]
MSDEFQELHSREITAVVEQLGYVVQDSAHAAG